MKIKSFFVPLTLIVIAAMFLTACASSSAQASNSATAAVSTVTQADTIQTTGSLSAAQLTSLAWGTTGTVDKVKVKVGQAVKAGDVLAILKGDSVPSAIITAQADLASAQRDLQNLMDSQASQAAAQLAVANAEQSVYDAQTALASLNFPRASEALVANTEAKIAQAKLAMAAASDKYRTVQRFADGTPTKTTAQLNLTSAQLNLNTLIATLDWYTGKPSTIDADVLRANLATAQASLADAKRTWQILQNGPDPVAVSAAQAKVNAAQAIVNGMEIIAPFDGEVLTVQTASGNPVNTGDSAFEIVNRNTLKVDTLVDETAITTVATGNTADISMEMLPGVTLKGKVTVISSIGTTVNGLVKYTVTVVLDPTTEAVRFGATTNVSIYTGQPHSMLAVPVGAVQTDTAGEYITIVSSDGSTQRVAITSGSISGNLVTFTTASKNLKAGDQVLVGSTTTSTSTSNSTTNRGGLFGGPGGN